MTGDWPEPPLLCHFKPEVCRIVTRRFLDRRIWQQTAKLLLAAPRNVGKLPKKQENHSLFFLRLPSSLSFNIQKGRPTERLPTVLALPSSTRVRERRMAKTTLTV